MREEGDLFVNRDFFVGTDVPSFPDVIRLIEMYWKMSISLPLVPYFPPEHDFREKKGEIKRERERERERNTKPFLDFHLLFLSLEATRK